MDRNKVWLWLICFFPVGLYLMYKHSDWPPFLKHLITGLGVFFSGLLLSSGKTFDFLIISGVFLIFFGGANLIYSFFTKNKKHTAGLFILYGMLFTFVGANQLNKQEQVVEKERIALEQEIAIEKQKTLEKKIAEEKQLAEEKKQQEIALKEEEKQKQEEQNKLDRERLEKATTAVVLTENEPLQENFDKAFTLVNALTQEDHDLNDRLETIMPLVEEYESQLTHLNQALDTATETKEREDYLFATQLASSLIVKNNTIDTQLVHLEKEITQLEEAEKERILKEEEEKAALAKEKAAQEVQQNPPPALVSPPSDSNAKTVFVAPHSGKKYHFSENCRGLSNANSVINTTISEATSQGYTLCGWED